MPKSQRGQYYVWYLGWKECRGLVGRHFTEPIVQQLTQRRRNDDLPRLSIEVTSKELRVTQIVEQQKKKKDEKIRFPSIPVRDVTFAAQGAFPNEDVVACIYLGFNERTQCAVHVHVYRLENPDHAAIFVDNLASVTSSPQHRERLRKIEKELFESGQVLLTPTGSRQDAQRRSMTSGGGVVMRKSSASNLGRQNSSGSGEGSQQGAMMNGRRSSQRKSSDSSHNTTSGLKNHGYYCQILSFKFKEIFNFF